MKTAQLDSFEKFRDVTKGYMVHINDHQLNQFKKFYEILLDWNKRINLISRKEENILEKHFLDSILFLPEIEGVIARKNEVLTKQSYKSNMQNEIASVAEFTPSEVWGLPRNDNFCVFDIGSGGGFPGIPLAIMKSEWHFVLCESIKKKAIFLEHVVNELKMEDRVEIVNDRVETCHGMSLHKNKYDLVTARAVGKLDELIKHALPLLKKGGYLLAYKSKNIGDEIKNITLPVLQIFSKTINDIERKLVVLSNPCIL